MQQQQQQAGSNRLHVVFIHLDLGIGGAESLVLNLAKATLRRDHGAGDEASGAPSFTPFEDDRAQRGGAVSIYTTHCSPTHCYDDVKAPDGPLFPCVRVRGSWIPRHLFFGGTALCSALRMLYLTFRAARENSHADVFVIDVLPTGVPFLTEYCNVNAGILFYCHFPDKLLTRDTVNGEITHDDGDGNNSATPVQWLSQLRKIYRWAMDTMEEWTMSHSDLIVVNSKFTRGEVEKVFPSLFTPSRSIGHTGGETLSGEGGETNEKVKVLYPAIDSKGRMRGDNGENDTVYERPECLGPIVSLNRFERKKNVALLIHAYDLLLERATNGRSTMDIPPLIIAGGYDPLNVENVQHLSELRALADEILERHNLPRSTVRSPSISGGDDHDYDVLDCTEGSANENPLLPKALVSFRPSVSNAERARLLSRASAWCYTPHREHFGIVPLEAMDAGVPVVAMRSGGPKETIVDGETGYLVEFVPSSNASEPRKDQTVIGFADAIEKLLSDRSRSQAMGQRGQKWVHKAFGMETFQRQWSELLRDVQRRGQERYRRGCTLYPSLGWSLVRSLEELVRVVLFVIALSWVWKIIGPLGQ